MRRPGESGRYRFVLFGFLPLSPVPLHTADRAFAAGCGRLGWAQSGRLRNAQQVRTVTWRGEQFLVLTGDESGEAGRGPQEDACPGRYGVGGAAVGVAGAVVQGERGRSSVVVAGAGGGELLEGGSGDQCGGDGRSQARVSVAVCSRWATRCAVGVVRGAGGGRCRQAIGSGVHGLVQGRGLS